MVGHSKVTLDCRHQYWLWICLVIWGLGVHLLILSVIFDDFPEPSVCVLYEAPGVRVDVVLFNHGIFGTFHSHRNCCLNLLWRVFQVTEVPGLETASTGYI